MDESTVLIDTSADDFEAWLTHYLSYIDPVDSLLSTHAQMRGCKLGTDYQDGIRVVYIDPVHVSFAQPDDLFPSESLLDTVMVFSIVPLTTQRAEVTAQRWGLPDFLGAARAPLTVEIDEYFQRVLSAIGERWPEAERPMLHGRRIEAEPTEPTAGKRERGPTARTIDRAAYFKKLKDQHPEWSQARVAIEASRPVEEGGLGEVVTADSVRNAYRSMGLKWERADRIRP